MRASQEILTPPSFATNRLPIAPRSTTLRPVGKSERVTANRVKVGASAAGAGIAALALARPAWATGIRPVDPSGPSLIFLFLMSLGCYGVYRSLSRDDRERMLPLVQLGVTLLAAAIVAAGFPPAAYLVTFPLGVALVRRKSWFGLFFLVLGVLISAPLFLLLVLVM